MIELQVAEGSVSAVAEAITPGKLGPLTAALLLRNLVRAGESLA